MLWNAESEHSLWFRFMKVYQFPCSKLLKEHLCFECYSTINLSVSTFMVNVASLQWCQQTLLFQCLRNSVWFAFIEARLYEAGTEQAFLMQSNQSTPAVDARAPTSILSPATPLPSAATTDPVPAPGTEWINFNLDKRSPITPPEWEDKVKKQKEEKAAKMQTSIRRRPPTGPPAHAVGPFEFKIENEDNLPRNILEEIVWNKDVEVQKVGLLWFVPLCSYFGL